MHPKSFKRLNRALLTTASLIPIVWAVPANAVVISADYFESQGGSYSDVQGTMLGVFDKLRADSFTRQWAASVRLNPSGDVCSGTWLGNNAENTKSYFLTAAHCFTSAATASPNENDPDVPIRMSVTYHYTPPSSNLIASRVANGNGIAHRNPLWIVPPAELGNIGTDLTVLELPYERPLRYNDNTNVEKPRLYIGNNTLNSDVSMVGYGLWGVADPNSSSANTAIEYSDNLNSSLIRRALAQFKITAVTENGYGLRAEWDKATGATTGKWGRSLSGDSGAGWWIEKGGIWSVVAPNRGRSSTSSTVWSVAPSLSNYVDFIRGVYADTLFYDYRDAASTASTTDVFDNLLVQAAHSGSLGTGLVTVAQKGELWATTDSVLNGNVLSNSGTIIFKNGSKQEISGLSGGGSITFEGSGTLTINSAADRNDTYSGQILGSGAFVKKGDGYLHLTGAASWSGATTISGGKLTLGKLSNLDSSASVVISTGAVLDISEKTGVTTLASLSGGGNLVLGGTLSLTTALGLDGVISGNGTLNLINATQTLNGDIDFVGSLNVAGGILTIGNGADSGALLNADVSGPAAIIFDRGTDSSFGGAILNASSVTKQGTGRLVLTGNSSYSGATTVEAGEFRINGTLANSDVTIKAGATLSGIGTATGDVTVATAAILSAGQSPGHLTLGSLTLEAGSRSIFELNTPGVIDDASNDLVTVTGALSLNGTLEARVASAGSYRLFDAGSVSGAFQNVELLAPLVTGANWNVYQFDDAGRAFVNLRVIGAGQSLQYWDGNGSAAGGSGTWSMSATNWSHEPTAPTTNDVWLDSVGVFGGEAGNVTVVGAQTFDTLQFNTDGYLLSEGAAGSLKLNGSGIINVTTGTTKLDLNVTSGTTAGLTKVGSGTLILSKDNAYTGTTAVQTGTLQLGDGGTTGSVTGDIVNQGLVRLNRSGDWTFANLVSGSGSLAIAGTGITTIDRAQAYAGDTILESGTLALSGNGDIAASAGLKLASSSSRFNIGNAAADVSLKTIMGTGDVELGQRNLKLTAASGNFAGSINGAGALTIQGNGTFVLAGNNSFSGGTIVDGATLQLGDGGGSGSVLGNIQNSGLVRFNRSDAVNFDGVISGSGGLEKAGSGTLILGSAQSYQGSTSVVAGTLSLAGGASLAASSGLSLAAGSSFDIAQAAGAIEVRSVSGAGTIKLGENSLSVRQAAGSLAGSISGNGGLELLGGALKLSGVNAYTGTTRISGSATLALSQDGSVSESDEINLADATAVLDISESWNGSSIKSLTGQGKVQLGAETLSLLSANSEFAGAISGTGGLSLKGGQFTLSGANSYSGATTIGGATLKLTGSGDISRSSEVFIDNAGGVLDLSAAQAGSSLASIGGIGSVVLGANTLALTSAFDTFSGSVSGSGGLTIKSGLLSLAGNNSYTGRTIVENGVLFLADGGSIERSSGVNLASREAGLDVSGNIGGTILADIAGSGAVFLGEETLTLQNAASTFTGDIRGPGNLNVSGGTLKLSGANTYTGKTSIGAATLAVVGSADISASSDVSLMTVDSLLDLSGATGTTSIKSIDGVGKISLGANTLALNVTSGKFGGSIVGIGGLNVQGGKLELTGVSTYTGVTNVQNGQLVLNGTIASPVELRAGKISGNGIAKELAAYAGSVIAPGNSIGTLTITNNYVQSAGSTYEAEIDQNGSADRVVVGGKAIIEEGAILTMLPMQEAATFTPGSRFTVLTAEDGVSGTYTVTPLSNFLTFDVISDSKAVSVELVQNQSFASAAATRNEISIAKALDGTDVDASLKSALLMLPDEESARQAFDRLSGEIHASIQAAFINDAQIAQSSAIDRLRSATDGVGVSSLPVMAFGPDGQVGMDNANTQKGVIWFQALGGQSTYENNGNAEELERSSGGFLAGVDGDVSDWRLGILGGYTESSFDVAQRASTAKSKSYQVGTYAGSQWNDLKLRFGGSYSWNEVETQRSIAFSGFSDTATADYSTRIAQAFAEVGYSVDLEGKKFEPFLGLTYVNVDSAGFTEQGGVAALTGADRSFSLPFATIGLRASTDVRFDNGLSLTPHASAAWRHAFDNAAPTSSLYLASGSSAFTIEGVPVAQDAAVVELGVDAEIKENIRLRTIYSGTFAKQARDNALRVNLNWAF